MARRLLNRNDCSTPRMSGSIAAEAAPDRSKGVDAVDLTLWIPALVFLGLATLGLMFAFVAACDKV